MNQLRKEISKESSSMSKYKRDIEMGRMYTSRYTELDKRKSKRIGLELEYFYADDERTVLEALEVSHVEEHSWA